MKEPRDFLIGSGLVQGPAHSSLRSGCCSRDWGAAPQGLKKDG